MKLQAIKRLCIAGAVLTAPALCAPGAGAEWALHPSRLYVGVNQPVVVSAIAESDAGLSVRLVDPRTGAEVERASVAPGAMDLAALFPTLWTRREPAMLYAQMYSGDEAVGSPVALQPLLAPPVAVDGLSAAILEAAKRGDRATLEQIVNSGASWRERLAQSVRLAPADNAGELNGLRVYELRDVTLETSAGTMRIALRPDEAPNTALHFLSLVEGGFYDGVPFHRIVNADARGRPFIVQCGDPTGTGAGGPGFRIPFERSELRHEFGVLSLARLPTDPNSGGSQFFICLSREACAALDEQYVGFAEVVEGADTLLTIAATPVGPLNPDNPSSPHERPLDPPVVVRARATPAPPLGNGPRRVTRESAAPAQR